VEGWLEERVLNSIPVEHGYESPVDCHTKGEMNYSVTEESVNSERYIEFLDGLIQGRKRPWILIVDQAPFHVKNKRDLKQRLYSALRSLQRQSERIRSFFQLPDTLYASMNVC
jgi:hypothetical protein